MLWAGATTQTQQANSLADELDRRVDRPNIAGHRLVPDRSLKTIETGQLDGTQLIDSLNLALQQRL